jgi:phytanoyl-CoA hydroxylase
MILWSVDPPVFAMCKKITVGSTAGSPGCPVMSAHRILLEEATDLVELPNVDASSARQAQPAAYSAAETPRAEYEREGFLIRLAVVPHDLIDALLDALHEDIFPSRSKFYRQNSARYEVNQFTANGYLANALLDFHDYRAYRRFSVAALELFFCEPLLIEMAALTGHDRMQLMQTMLMDANPTTPPHQDWWYPDTVPNGNLIAAWIALEDIDERAGRFYVMRDSHDVVLHHDIETLSHSEWLARMDEWKADHSDNLVAPALRKGDVLFWNSSTIHGSLPTRDQRFSRKSATAHYIPEGATFGNLFKTKDYIQLKEFKGWKFYKNQPDYSRLNVARSAIRKRAYEHPALIRTLLRIQGKI